jgi:acyl-CoA synthetase (AMP-forming)/AMP-acid ligase II
LSRSKRNLLKTTRERHFVPTSRNGSRIAGPVDTSNLKLICYGGGPMYVADTLRALEVFGPNLVQIFGQGESPMTITYLAREIHADLTHPRFQERLGSVGIARTDSEFRVVDAEDRCLPVGETGEVVVRGEVVMAGYWRWSQPVDATLSLRGQRSIIG